MLPGKGMDHDLTLEDPEGENMGLKIVPAESVRDCFVYVKHNG